MISKTIDEVFASQQVRPPSSPEPCSPLPVSGAKIGDASD
jgi:hypothetical protein